MSETIETNINSLYLTVLRESENDSVRELPPNFYRLISNFIGKLKREEYDGLEAKVKDELVRIATELTESLLSIRLDKITKTNSINYTNLLDEEKFILDSENELRERREMILSATLNGKSKLLESISEKHKTKSIAVRFLKEMDQIVGADLEKYGPFRSEDVATIPFENAQALIAKNIVMKVRIED
jgi:DNA replication factor GINS